MKKLSILIGSLFLIVIVSFAILPYFFKDKIIAMVNEEASKEMNAKLSLKEVDLSLIQNIKQFPNMSIILDGLTIVGKEQFSLDTLVTSDKILLSIDIQSLFQSEKPIQINSIDIQNADIRAIVDTAGKGNWDIMKEGNNSDKKSKFSLNLSELNLENINVYYRDKMTDKTLEIQHLNHHGSGDFTDNLVNYESKTDIEDCSFFDGLIPYLKNAKIKNQSTIAINQSEKKYSIKDNSIFINDLSLILNGDIQQKETNAMDLNINFKTEDNEFKKVLSLIPTIYKNNFEDLITKGKFDLKGSVTGLYKGDLYPKMDIVFNVNNAEFQYPDLPNKVSNIEINSSVNNPGGSLDNMVIDISKFSMMLGSDPFSGRLNLKQPISNPLIDLYTKGKINLSDVQKFYPMNDVKKFSGIMNLDLEIKANKSDLVNKNYAAISAKGLANIKNLIYESSSVEKSLNISDVMLEFSPQYVNVPICMGTIGKSDFNLKGKLENFIGYYMSKDAVMSGNISFASRMIDMNEFSSDKKESKSEYVYVPKNIDFKGNASIQSMKYGKMTIQNLIGEIAIKDENIRLNNVNAELLGGKAKISALYSTKGETKPVTQMQYDIESFDITQVYHYMESAPKLAPIMQYMTGKLSSNSNLTMTILPDMSPDLNTLNGDFTAAIPTAKIVNLPILQKIVEVSKFTPLNNLEAQNIQAKMSFVNGKIILNPTFFKANNYNIGIQGMQGLDKSIDYIMSVDVPFAQLGNASSVVNGLIQKFKLPFVGNINPETIRLNFNIKGFFEKPQVSLGKPEILTNGKPADAQTVAVDAIKKIGEDAKAQAIKTADSFKNIAIKEGQKKAEELKKQAENQLEEARKKAEKEVNKKKDDLLNDIKKKLPW